jgi:hypothetical protein
MTFDATRPATRTELRKFGLLVGGAFLLLGSFFAWRRGLGPLAIGLGGAGALLVAGGAIAPRALGPVYAGWMRFALALSRVTTPIFMGAMYFIVITPTSFVMRILGKRPLRIRTGSTVWVTREVGSRQGVLERQF